MFLSPCVMFVIYLKWTNSCLYNKRYLLPVQFRCTCGMVFQSQRDLIRWRKGRGTDCAYHNSLFTCQWVLWGPMLYSGYIKLCEEFPGGWPSRGLETYNLCLDGTLCLVVLHGETWKMGNISFQGKKTGQQHSPNLWSFLLDVTTKFSNY